MNQTQIDPFARDRFLLHQKRLALTHKYNVFDEAGQTVLFVEREAHHLKQILAFLGALVGGGIIFGAAVGIVFLLETPSSRYETLQMVVFIAGLVLAIVGMLLVGIWLRPKRHIAFFTDNTRATPVLKVYQDKKFHFLNATYTVSDPQFTLLGWLRKNYLYDLFRKRWYGHGANGELACIAMEDSIWKSMARRLLRSVDLPFMRTNFIIVAPDGVTKLGEFNRKFTLFDKYVLDMTPDGQRVLDRRLALALGVLLDTGERR